MVVIMLKKFLFQFQNYYNSIPNVFLRMFSGLKLLFVFAVLLLIHSQAFGEIIKTHALSLTETIKYDADFKHFDYANPNAPKGGIFRRAIIGTYDSFNPFALKGVAFRSSGYMYDTILTSSSDEPLTYYGLLAESIEYDGDFSWVIFNLRTNAKWHDGKPITAEDVVFSFNKTMEISPFYKEYYRLIVKVEALSPHRVKFTFSAEEKSRELPLIAGQMTIIPKHYWEKRDLSKSTLEKPLGSGPYRIGAFEAGKSVTFERVNDYWGADLPVNNGFNNFDKVIFEYFRDQTVAFEAFKAGHFDLTAENSDSRWYRGYTGKYFDLGAIKKEEIPYKNAEGMLGIALNTVVKPLDDINVRKALNYAFDYDWINKNIYFGQEKRHDSYFSNSELACGALPAPEVAEVIKRVKPDAPKEFFETPFILPSTDGSGNNRENLIEAVKLFEKAGYKLANGKMIGPDGKKLSLEITTSSKVVENELLSFQKALERIGIDFYIRFLDSAQYVDKVRNKDYMMIYVRVKQSESPGNEQRSMWGAAAADEAGSRNYARIKDPSIDRLIEMIVSAPNRKTLVTYARALDRILLEGWYFIPTGYSDRYRIAYWDKFGFPEKRAAYGVALDSWWVDKEKQRKIDALLRP
ncbi:MAG: extracellular solute-binding protein [Deferribacteraceae bacterium]|jgi:microcin C transport system substrate-binding protein|nr:extracellular solute-binding protein [Deferribacteraceae bacterium]